MPAAAVIPAPVAYIKVVAVKKLVVEFLSWFLLNQPFLSQEIHFEEIRAFQAGVSFVYISMV